MRLMDACCATDSLLPVFWRHYVSSTRLSWRNDWKREQIRNQFPL